MLNKLAYLFAAILVAVLVLDGLVTFDFISSPDPSHVRFVVELVQTGFIIFIGLDHSRRLTALEGR